MMITNICSYFTVCKILSFMLYLFLCSVSMKIIFIVINTCSFVNDLGKLFNLELKLTFIYKILIFTKFSVVAFCEKWSMLIGGVGCVCVQRNSTDSDSVCKYKPIAMVFLCSCTGLLKVILMEEWNQGQKRWTRMCVHTCPFCGRDTQKVTKNSAKGSCREHLTICLQWAWILLCFDYNGKVSSFITNLLSTSLSQVW